MQGKFTDQVRKRERENSGTDEEVHKKPFTYVGVPVPNVAALSQSNQIDVIGDSDFQESAATPKLQPSPTTAPRSTPDFNNQATPDSNKERNIQTNAQNVQKLDEERNTKRSNEKRR